MKLKQHLSSFLKQHELTDHPFLLALSGGSDSMALFYCLLSLRERFSFGLHITYVDHGWREESKKEAEELFKLAEKEGLPFHLKTLNPSEMKGNLEDACRRARYEFFTELCKEHQLRGVMIAHHSDDQAETILKRVFEGSHWSKLSGLQEKATRGELAIYRPFLSISKKEITHFLTEQKISYFEDKTNHDINFLRAKMRHQMLPWLNQSFGKDITSALLNLGKEARDMSQFLEITIQPLLSQAERGPSGVSLDLSHVQLHDLIVKTLIRKLCEEQGFVPSRQILEQSAQALQTGKAHKKYAMGENCLRIDRKHLFITVSS